MVILNSKVRHLPADAVYKNAVGERKREDYDRVMDQFSVETNPRYAPESGRTFCNIFVWDVTRAMDAEIPHWIDADNAPSKPHLPNRETTANMLFDWLDVHGPRHGWKPCGPLQAQLLASSGFPTVAVWKNPRPDHSGHIAMVRPGPWKPGAPWIAQAGKVNFARTLHVNGFGSYVPKFYTHS